VSLGTHGRWPWLAAGGLLPVALLASRRREWAPLAALLAHQTEEWVWPGGFLPWFNHAVMGSGEDEFPLTRRLAVAINCWMGWGLSGIAATVPERAAAPAALLFTSHLGNAGLHAAMAIRERRWNPGSVTGPALLLPVGVSGLRRLWGDPRISRRAVTAGAIGGIALSALLPIALRRRMRS
jgi:hypothetical protein